MDLTGIFLTLGGLVGFVLVVTDVIIRIFKTEKKIDKQITAWSLSIGLSLLGYFLNQGMFAELTWWASILTGIGAGLSANGLASVEKVKAGLDIILNWLGKKP